MIKSIIILLVSFLCFNLYSQSYTSKSSKAIKKIDEARTLFDQRKYEDAIKNAQDAIQLDVNFIEAYLLLAAIYKELGDIQNTIEIYKKGLQINPTFFPNAFFDLANLEFSKGLYLDAKNHFNTFLSQKGISEKFKDRALKGILNCDFALQSIKNPVPFNPQNLGENVNSKYDEYWPGMTVDGKFLVFTRLMPIDTSNNKSVNNRQEDLYYTIKENNQWKKAQSLSIYINTGSNEGAQTVTADGKKMYFTACNRSDGKGMCDIYFSEKKNGEWTKPVNLGFPINTKFSEKQPSISPDGKTIYFASNRDSTKGLLDIWVSTLNNNGSWSKPINLGDSVNTALDETSPFIHSDNQSLYFSSQGHIGLGGYDLYLVKKNKKEIWGTVQNLGYPINTFYNEEGMFVVADGEKALFSSDRLSNNGRDIYEFDLTEKNKPIAVSYMKGIVYDAVSKSPLIASFELIDLKNSKKIMEVTSNNKGEFLVTIPTNCNYALNVAKQGYLFYSANFLIEKQQSYLEPYLVDVPLQPINMGDKIVLRNIFFESDKYILQDESKVELNKTVQFLKDNPSLKIEIGGHTDNSSNKEYNLKLSENRAKAVVEYLITNSIKPERLSFKGYGETLPISTNETEEGKALNRRTELKVVGK